MRVGCEEAAPDCRESIPECATQRDARSGFKSESPDGVEAGIRNYIENHRARAARELEYFRRVLRSDEEAVSRAALAQLPSGKRHPHQYRIPSTALEESWRVLLGILCALRQSASFDELFDLVGELTEPISGIGELTVYDTALRIGAHFGLEPTRVYVHAGTRDFG